MCLRDLGRQLHQPAVDELVETRLRRTRQSRIVGAAMLAVAALAGVGVLTSTGGNARTDPSSDRTDAHTDAVTDSYP